MCIFSCPDNPPKVTQVLPSDGGILVKCRILALDVRIAGHTDFIFSEAGRHRQGALGQIEVITILCAWNAVLVYRWLWV